ncbi:hypothetical protein ACYATP_05525 [Lactobacillaceae bacterium Melli_B4]
MKKASMTMVATIILLLLVTLLQFQMVLLTKEVHTNQLMHHDYQNRTNAYLHGRN